MESMVTSVSVTPIQAAEGAVRRYCGWHIAPVATETLVLDGTGTRLALPSHLVLAGHPDQRHPLQRS